MGSAEIKFPSPQVLTDPRFVVIAVVQFLLPGLWKQGLRGYLNGVK